MEIVGMLVVAALAMVLVAAFARWSRPDVVERDRAEVESRTRAR